MSLLPDRSFPALRRRAAACRRGLAGVGAAVLVLGAMNPLWARPPYGDPPPQGRRQVQDADRAEIRRSVGRSEQEYPPPDAYRGRRPMSDAERQSLRQAVRDAYGDPRARPNR